MQEDETKDATNQISAFDVPESAIANDPNQELETAKQATVAVVKGGSGWIYAVAALSFINTIITLFHGDIAFIVGLAITQIFDALIVEMGRQAAFIVVPVNLIIAGIFAALGFFASRAARWAFVTGLILYALDMILLLLLITQFEMDRSLIISLIFHVYVLYVIGKSIVAVGTLRKLEAQRTHWPKTV